MNVVEETQRYYGEILKNHPTSKLMLVVLMRVYLDMLKIN